MNFRKPLVAAAALSALMSVAAPAQAFSFLGATSNANGSFSFAKNTTVQFDFFASHGAYKSDFGVYSAKNKDSLLQTLFSEHLSKDPGSNNANDSKGTCSASKSNLHAVLPCTNTFTFAKGVSYFLGLTGGSKTVYTGDLTTYSNDDAKAETFQFVNAGEQFVYYTSYENKLTKRNSEKITVDPGTTLIAVNDSWSGDADYNDFVVKAKKSEAVPEPGTVGALLGAGALGLINRRRKAGEAEKA